MCGTSLHTNDCTPKPVDAMQKCSGHQELYGPMSYCITIETEKNYCGNTPCGIHPPLRAPKSGGGGLKVKETFLGPVCVKCANLGRWKSHKKSHGQAMKKPQTLLYRLDERHKKGHDKVMSKSITSNEQSSKKLFWPYQSCV